MTAYYNEIDPYCVEWLRNLIREGLIADGHIDSRSIADVTPNDLRGFTQCHFFAGLGGWSAALRSSGGCITAHASDFYCRKGGILPQVPGTDWRLRSCTAA